jgi:hypothetical protein
MESGRPLAIGLAAGSAAFGDVWEDLAKYTYGDPGNAAEKKVRTA